MSCIKSFFRCNFSENSQNNTWYEKNISFLRSKIIDLELEVKSIKLSHDLEMKRIEDKIISQIQMLTNKIDNILLIVNNKN